MAVDLDIDPSHNIVVTGSCGGHITLIKYNTAGSMLWQENDIDHTGSTDMTMEYLLKPNTDYVYKLENTI